MSRVFPGFLGTFGPGTLAVMSGRISRDVPSCPRTSWDLWRWDFGSHVCKDIPGYPELSQDFLGLLDVRTLVVVSCRSTGDIPGCPNILAGLLRTSQVVPFIFLRTRTVRGSPGPP